MSSKEVVISQGKRSLFHRIIASLGYTLGAFCIYRGLTELREIVAYFYLAAFLLTFAFRFSVSKYYKFDREKKRYKNMSTIGLITWGSWSSYESLDYVAVFQIESDLYAINIWYNEHEHFTLGGHKDRVSALDAGTSIALELELDLWDATDPYNGDWVTIDKKS